jgi:hypothetical protein
LIRGRGDFKLIFMVNKPLYDIMILFQMQTYDNELNQHKEACVKNVAT